MAANALDDFRDSTELAKTLLELGPSNWLTGWPYRKFGYVASGFLCADRVCSCGVPYRFKRVGAELAEHSRSCRRRRSCWQSQSFLPA